MAKVTKSAFDSCNETNALAVLTKPPAKVTLSGVGQQYFICTVTGHCSAGQKLSIYVDEASNLPVFPPTAPVPSPVQEPAPTATLSPAPASGMYFTLLLIFRRGAQSGRKPREPFS